MALALCNLEPLSTFALAVRLHALAELDLLTEWIYLKDK